MRERRQSPPFTYLVVAVFQKPPEGFRPAFYKTINDNKSFPRLQNTHHFLNERFLAKSFTVTAAFKRIGAVSGIVLKWQLCVIAKYQLNVTIKTGGLVQLMSFIYLPLNNSYAFYLFIRILPRK